ncbi:hypothetical protein DDD_2536 [Nonlabens dokdonensis DSW-6]|uniref:Uncharacterized protein n=1 Tax=Nonlabens dokdonensis (strain DSM 17205 / KCTC 12402 / DSW-6) TaxID=592029 RepID=L7WFI1_NONDD|nr:hypothetical protein DDD_2536 [Nonlabens dokdonensis DSW-6]
MASPLVRRGPSVLAFAKARSFLMNYRQLLSLKKERWAKRAVASFGRKG